MIRRRPF